MREILEIGPGGFPINEANCFSYERWGERPLPWQSGRFDEVYASHVIEHVSWYLVAHALADVLRLLRPGGMVELWTMNLDKLLAARAAGGCGDGWRRLNPDGDPWAWFNGRLFAYEREDGQNWHRSAFTPDDLSRLLCEAGFVGAALCPVRSRGRSHGPCEFGMTAWRPE